MPELVEYETAHAYSEIPATDLPAPFLPIRLAFGDEHVDTLGLVDSGAPTTLVNTEFLAALGINPFSAPAENIDGVGGEATARFFDIIISALGHEFPARVGFSDGCPVEYCLLGREDFFRHFEIGFDQLAGRFLTRHK
jgi:hypothetical protein